MSQQSFLNIQEISSRMYNPDSSIMDTSLEQFGKEAQNTNNMYTLPYTAWPRAQKNQYTPPTKK